MIKPFFVYSMESLQCPLPCQGEANFEIFHPPLPKYPHPILRALAPLLIHYQATLIQINWIWIEIQDFGPIWIRIQGYNNTLKEKSLNNLKE